MAIPDVGIEDVARRYENDLAAEFRTDYVEQAIEDARDVVVSRWGAAISSRLSTGALTENSFKAVIAGAVLRVIRNPGGLASENEMSYGYSTRVQVSAGWLYFSEDDIVTLTGMTSTTIPGTIGIGLDRGWS